MSECSVAQYNLVDQKFMKNAGTLAVLLSLSWCECFVAQGERFIWDRDMICTSAKVSLCVIPLQLWEKVYNSSLVRLNELELGLQN